MYGVISLCFPFCRKEMYSLCHFLTALMLSEKKNIDWFNHVKMSQQYTNNEMMHTFERSCSIFASIPTMLVFILQQNHGYIEINITITENNTTSTSNWLTEEV